MDNKKIVCCLLLLSFQAFCMLIVPSKNDSKQIRRLADASEKIAPLHWKKSDALNRQFCFNSNRYDIPTITIMSELDYKSNIQFISTCKYLYKEYGHGENSKFLFTHYVNSIDYKRVINCFDNAQDFYKIIETDNILRQHIMILAANPICLQYFLKQGLSPNNKSDDGEPLIYCFIGAESAIPLKILLSDHRTDPNMQNKYGDTALMLAACCNDIEKLKILLADHRVDANIQDKNGNTALMRAVSCDSIEALKRLLEDHRVDSNIQDKDGNTAIMIAAHYNRIEALKILFAHNKVKMGNTFYRLKSTGYLAEKLEIIQLLSEHTSLYEKCMPHVINVGAVTIAVMLLMGCEQFVKKIA